MKKTTTAVIVLALATHSFNAWAIDCSKNISPVETMICKSPELTLKDITLNDKYKLASMIATNKSALKNEQNAWLHTNRNRCTDNRCLTQAYSKRISELEERINTVAQTCITQESSIIGTWIGTRDAEFDSFELDKDHSFSSWRNDRPEYSGKKWEFDSKNCQLKLFSGADKIEFLYRIMIMPNKQLITINQEPTKSSVYKRNLK